MDESLFTVDLEPSGRSANGSARHEQFLLSAFIGDSETELVRVALERVRAKDSTCSPLLLYGPSGVGKSLLARALYGRLQRETGQRETGQRETGQRETGQRETGQREVLFYTGATFSKACGLAAETNSLPEFRRRLQNLSGLIIDDLQQTAGKSLVQDELRHALDQLTRRRRWVVATMRHLPAEIKGLSPSVKSRLLAGLVIPLTAPGKKARREILRRLSFTHALELSGEVLDDLSDGGTASFSHATRTRLTPTHPLTAIQLDQMLQRLVEAANDKPIDVDQARQMRGESWKASQPDLRSISSAVARYFDQTIDDLKGPLRRKELVQARGIAMYLARQLTDNSFGQVGKHFGDRDHTTVMHACRRIQKLMLQDAAIRKAVEDVAAQFANA